VLSLVSFAVGVIGVVATILEFMFGDTENAVLRIGLGLLLLFSTVGLLVIGLSSKEFALWRALDVEPVFSDRRWQPYLLLGYAFALLVVIFDITRMRSGKGNQEELVLKGTQSFPAPSSSYVASDSGSDAIQPIEVEIFYPRLFKHTPNLTVSFPKRRVHGCLAPDIPTRPEYKITDQRPDGFVIQVSKLWIHEPLLEWEAAGQPSDD